jgi:Na+-driven multidrug efflux pump
MIAALAGPQSVRLVTCWTLAFYLDLGLLGIWLGSTTDWAVRTIGLGAVFQRGRWQTIRVLRGE